MSNFTNNHYDIIVVGLGGHGSSTLANIALNCPEKKVLGLEQFNLTHGKGSSHGRSRIYRQAYFEHPSCKFFIFFLSFLSLLYLMFYPYTLFGI